jgi:PAS domain S-box-containing protein
VEKVLQTGMVIGLANHTVLVARDGTERILADSGAPIIDTDDKIIGVALVFRDVTEETLTQRRLSEEEARYRHIFESSNHLISLYSPVGKCLIMNPTVASYFNGKPEDFVGKSFIELHPEGGEEFERRIHEVIENWESREYEDPVNFPIGIRWLYSEVSPIHIPREDLTAAQIVSIDITDRKVAEEKLRESKELLQATGGIAKVGGWELDARTMEVKWTEETYRIHEVPLDYKPPLDEAINFFHPDDRPALQKAISEALQRGRPYDLEMRFITAKGRRLWTRTMCRPEVVDGEVVKLRGVFQDMTELKEAEQLIESQNFHLKLSQRMARIGYWSFDIETGRPTWSDMMFTVLGRDPARGVPHYDEHREFIHPDDWELFDSAVQGAINGKPYIIELRIIFPDQSLHYVTAQGHPQVNEKGEVVTLFGTTQDITNRKRLEEQALSAERLRAVGELASGVAHNFNNLLQIVLGGSQLALTDLELGNFSQARRNLEQIVESARFGAQTVKRLQDFARFRKDKPLESSRVFDLSQTVDEAVEMSKPWWKTKPEKDGISITLSRKLHKGCYVEGNENEIFEVAVNLIKNAAEAMSKGGELRVRTFYDETNGYLIVEDQGVGISDADIKRIFDPFWSTKGPKGTGMGLASSYGIVQRHQGRINAQSREGYGTTFTVSIPLTGSAPVLNGSSTIPDFGFNLEILVVDDMPAVVKQLGSGLSTFGQSVYTALSGVEAVDIFRETRVDVVISDLAMPGMNGLALAREIQEISREQKRERPIFIILTGWGAQVGDETRDEDSGVDAILQKPIDAAKLLDRIKELLNL